MNNFDEFGDYIDDNYYSKTPFEIEVEAHSPGLEGIIKEVNSRRDFPLLYPYITQEQNITKESFFTYILDNFEKFNENEFEVINKNFFVRDYIHIMFEYVLDNNILINQQMFNDYLYSNTKHFNHVKKDYQQQLVTYYAFHNFDKIQDNEWKLIFEPVYEFEYRHLFATLSFEPQKNVLNKTFWSFFTPDSNIVKSYLQHITKNNLHKSMSFMCEHFNSYVHNYLYGQHSKKEKLDTTILEQHYIFHNPQHCIISNLEYKNLNQVFARIYQLIPDKNLTSKTNQEFYDKLEKGIYYLFDYLSQKEPDNLHSFFEQKPKAFSHLLEDLDTASYKLLNNEFQKIFFTNVFSKNLDLLYQQADCIKKTIIQNIESNTPIKEFLRANIDLLSSEDKQHLIFATVKNNIMKFNMPLLIEQLMDFSIDSLKHFTQNINIYLNIINDTHECKTQFEEIKESVNKAIINKNLTNKLNNDTPNKIKRSKI